MELSKLCDPFPAEDIEWRVQSSGKTGEGKVWARVLAYVTSRAVQERLDEAVGPGNWQNVFTVGPGGGVLCGISIKVDNEWITKWDGADNTDVEAVKGGLSGAMKRAAVQWGIGRYLYKLPAGWAQLVADKKQALHSDKLKDGREWFHWNPPPLPPWALPATTTASGYPSGAPPYQPEPAEEPGPPKAAAPTKEDLAELIAAGKANSLAKAAIASLSVERFGRPPSALYRREFGALMDRVRHGAWLPDDIDRPAAGQKDEAA